MSQADVHAEAREQEDLRKRNRNRFFVAFGIRPDDRNFDAFQIAAEFFLHRHEVGDGLHRVIQIALEVHDGDGRPFRHFGDEFVAIAPVAIAHGDTVAEAAQDDSGIFRAFAMGQLRGAAIDEVTVTAQLGDAGFHRVTRTRRLFHEHEENRLIFQHIVDVTQRKIAFEVERNI